MFLRVSESLSDITPLSLILAKIFECEASRKSNNLDSNLVLEIDDSIIIDKKIIDFFNSYSKKSKKSFIVVSSNLNYQVHSFTLVPTFQEAKDIIQIEEIERLIG